MKEQQDNPLKAVPGNEDWKPVENENFKGVIHDEGAEAAAPTDEALPRSEQDYEDRILREKPELVENFKLRPRTRTDFIHYIVRDQHGNVAAFQSISRSQIIHYFFSIADGVLVIVLTEQVSTLRPFTPNPKGSEDVERDESTPAPEVPSAYGSLTQHKTIYIGHEEEIVDIVNTLEGTKYKTSDYPGFVERKRQGLLFEQAKIRKLRQERKEKAEADKNVKTTVENGELKTEGGIILPPQ